MSDAYADYQNLVEDRNQLREHNETLRDRVADLEAYNDDLVRASERADRFAFACVREEGITTTEALERQRRYISDLEREVCEWRAVAEKREEERIAAVPQSSVADICNATTALGLLKGVIDRNVAHNPEYAAKVQAEYDWIVTVLRMYEAAPIAHRKILTVLRCMHDGRLVGSPTYRNSPLYDGVVSAMATLAGMAASQQEGGV